MIFELVHDFAAALAAMPIAHPRRRILALLDEAIRRDVHFLDRHPTTLFQCLWNSCWWYDCGQAAGHYLPHERRGQRLLPWDLPAEQRLSTLLVRWRGELPTADPAFSHFSVLSVFSNGAAFALSRESAPSTTKSFFRHKSHRHSLKKILGEKFLYSG